MNCILKSKFSENWMRNQLCAVERAKRHPRLLNPFFNLHTTRTHTVWYHHSSGPCRRSMHTYRLNIEHWKVWNAFAVIELSFSHSLFLFQFRTNYLFSFSLEKSLIPITLPLFPSKYKLSNHFSLFWTI